MRSRLLSGAVLAVLVAAVAAVGSRQGAAAAAFPNDDQTIVHALNRIGFGPRPDDIAKVRAMGLQAYIDQQLHPERLADAQMEARLAEMTTLRMTPREIAEQFTQPLLQARRDRKQAAANQPDDAAKMPTMAQQQANRVMVELTSAKVLRAAYSERQLQEVLTDFWFNHFNVDARKGQDRFMLTAYERDTIRPHVLGKFRDLLGATAKSPAMLFYLDNWMSADPNGPHSDDLQMRPRNFPARRPGRVGQSFPNPQLPRRPNAPAQQPNAQQNMRKGLNENYGRELMELHTLGVEGGYTQKDVTEVARAFTGWTILNPRAGGSFVFDRRIHDPGQKVVLGHVIKSGGGEEDGEQVLDILATHPSTARFIATKLARRFVSDTPPPALVDRLAARFHDTDGDLREVMRTLLTSSEFLAPDARRAKVKTPFEFVVSTVRGTGIDVPNATPLVRAVQQLGMPLYQCQPPTGYKDTADAWVNTGALVNRMNFALQLANGSLRAGGLQAGNNRAARPRQGARDRADGTGDSAGNALQGVAGRTADADQIIATVLNNNVAATTRETIGKATTSEQKLALVLGSPEFQRR